MFSLLITAAALTLPGCSSPASSQGAADEPGQTARDGFAVKGLISPATVADSIFVYADGLPQGASVIFSVDGQMQPAQGQAPYWLGGLSGGTPVGFSVNALSPGLHQLTAVAKHADGTSAASSSIQLNVVPSINSQFSAGLARYPNELSAQQNDPLTLLQSASTPGASLSSSEQAVRRQVFNMYLNWGIDPSLDSRHDQSTLLLSLAPQGWAAATYTAGSRPLSMLFSPDAPYYHPIPALWPRVGLPIGYFRHLQLNTSQQGDGIGFGEVTAAPSDPDLTVTSQWYGDTATLRKFQYPMPSHWAQSLPTEPAGDMHMIFVDPQGSTFVSSYKTSVDPVTAGPDALYASSPTLLGTLGDRGGSIAANFAELPAMLQPGEATDPHLPIRHAIGGSVARVWATRVFPASAWDGGVKTSTNTCTGSGSINTGLIPYGGVIQLDPKIDLSTFKLTLPARRILEAMQTYGYYVMDFGCTDIDIYTAIPESELEAYGGLYGNSAGIGVQNEIERVLIMNTLYVVAPLTKKQ